MQLYGLIFDAVFKYWCIITAQSVVLNDSFISKLTVLWVCWTAVKWITKSPLAHPERVTGVFSFPSKFFEFLLWPNFHRLLHTGLAIRYLLTRKQEILAYHQSIPHVFTRNGFSPWRKIQLPIWRLHPQSSLGSLDLEGTSTDIRALTCSEWDAVLLLFHNEGAEIVKYSTCLDQDKIILY